LKPGKKIWWLLAVIFAALLVALVCGVDWREPVYKGRSFSSWFRDAEQVPYIYTNSPATDAIAAMGTNAIPYLVERLHQEDPWWLEPYRVRYPKLPAKIRDQLPPPRPPRARQSSAARFLYRLGPDGRAAMPGILAVYEREYQRLHDLPLNGKVDWTTQLTNPPAPPSPSRLQSVDTTLRGMLLIAVGLCGGENQETIPLLFTATRDPMPFMRIEAFDRLRHATNLVPAIALAEPFLLATLTNADAPTRSVAANVLNRIAPTHPEIVAPLLAAAEDPDPGVRHEALEALRAAKPDLQTVMPVLGRLLADPSGATRGPALHLISASAGGKVLPALNDLLTNANPEVRRGAALTIAYYHGSAEIAIPRLQQLTNPATEPDESVRHAAAETLKKLSPQVH
jgi:hypothetical protein